MKNGRTTMIYERPDIRESTSLDLFFERLVPRRVQPPADTEWRTKILAEFIDSSPGRARLNLEEICKQLGLPISGRQARRLFTLSTGMGFRKYARNRCLTVAAEQLRVTNVPIKVIAADAGYQCASHFARSFKALFRVNPMEFRRVWRQKSVAA